jgi:hypothetical protein
VFSVAKRFATQAGLVPQAFERARRRVPDVATPRFEVNRKQEYARTATAIHRGVFNELMHDS